MTFSKDHVFAALKDIAAIFWPPATVLALHVLRLLFLPLATPLDMLMHFSGGLTIAWSVTNAYSLLRRHGLATGLKFVEFAFVLVAATTLIGVLWEFMEYFFAQHAMIRMGINLYNDTLSDLALDMLGASVWTGIEAFRGRK